MALVNAYTTVEALRSRSTITHTDRDPQLEAAVQAASRGVDRVCARRFWDSVTPSARVFHADDPYRLYVDDFSTVTGLLVATDEADSGSYTTTKTITTDFVCYPANGERDGLAGWPFEALEAVSFYWPTGGRRPNRVQVTARWGWAAVPDPVSSATLIVASELLRLGDAPFGVILSEFGTVARIRDNPIVMAMLAPYMRGSMVGV